MCAVSVPRQFIIPLGLGICIAVFWLCVLFRIAPTPDPTSDFAGYYISATLLRTGHSPYDLPAQHALREQLVGTSDSNAILWYFYPPYFLLLILPLTWLSVGTANTAWLALHVCIVWPVCMYLLCKRLPRAWPFVAVWAFSWAPMFVTLWAGQVSLLLLCAALLCADAMLEERDWSASVWAPLLALKPVFVIAPIVVLLYFRRWRALMIGIGATTMLFAVVVGLYGPNILTDYVASMRYAATLQATNPSWRSLTCSLAAIAYRLGLMETPALLLLTAGILALWWQMLRWDVTDAVYLAPVTGLLINPHVHIYDVVLSLAVLPVLVSRPIRTWMALLSFGYFFPVIAEKLIPSVVPFGPPIMALWLLAVFGTTVCMRPSVYGSAPAIIAAISPEVR